MEIKNTKSLEANPKLNVLLYGAPGSGKTTIAGTFPKPLYLNIEAGVNTLVGQDIDFVDITEWEDIKDVYNQLRNGEIKYESVIIDSVTELMKKRGLEIAGSKDQLSMRDWGILIKDIEDMMRRFRDLSQHVLFIFAEQEEKDGDRIVKRPSVSGKSLPTTACGMVDLVGYTKVLKEKTIKYVTQFTPDEIVYAKSRFRNIKGDVEDTSFKILKSLMKGGAIEEKIAPEVKEVLEKIK